MFWWLVAVALAAEETVPVVFDAPAEVALFSSARIVDAKGVAKGDDCTAAVLAAIADAAGDNGQVLRIVTSEDVLTPPTEARCKKRMQGDDVAASVVELKAVVAEPGDGATIPGERAVQMVSIMRALIGLEGTSIRTLEGKSYLDLGGRAIKDELDSGKLDTNARAFGAYNAHISDWLRQWSGAIGALPELYGAVLEVEVGSNDPTKKKSKLREVFRFVVPAASVSAFMSGGLTDEELLVACAVFRAADAKKPVFEPYALDVSDGVLAIDRDFESVGRSGLDVPDEDLVGVEDED